MTILSLTFLFESISADEHAGSFGQIDIPVKIPGSKLGPFTLCTNPSRLLTLGSKISTLKVPKDPEFPGLVAYVNIITIPVFAGMSSSISFNVTRLFESREHSRRGRTSEVHGGGPSRLRVVGNWIVTLDSAGIMLVDSIRIVYWETKDG